MHDRELNGIRIPRLKYKVNLLSKMSFKDVCHTTWLEYGVVTHYKNRQMDIFSSLVESTPILLVWVEAVEVEAYC